ncbi:hypothetical protein LCGC14_1195580 [marine sediment metagenome]|uniref:Uncharacterized protein n=1 Tax=marine sediment metagenome TaxID=412755 RepID=A0A0F9LMX9_9ZZZZ
MKRIRFILDNWKLIIHLLFRTNRFGVNNQLSSTFDSMFGGWTVQERIINTIKVKPIIHNYRMVKWRATAIGVLDKKTCEILGWKSELQRRNYQSNEAAGRG